MMRVHCRGCGRQIGVATDKHSGIYCEEVCSLFEPSSPNDARDDAIDLLDRLRVARDVLSMEFGVTRQRVSQIIIQRRRVAA